jgi:hypothetical protein
MPSTAPNISERIQQLFEPAARATRRGDALQIRKVLDELRLIWRSAQPKKKVERDVEVARGMTFALESVLGIVLATSGADAQRALVGGRKYALPILHALGRKARESVQTSQSSGIQLNESVASIKKGELARTVGMLAQNIGELVNTMKDCGLVSVTEEGPASRVAITDAGLEMLESARPGWQVQQVDRDTLGQHLDEILTAALQELQGLSHVQHGEPSSTRMFLTLGKIKPHFMIGCRRSDPFERWIKHSEMPKGYRLHKDHSDKKLLQFCTQVISSESQS